MKIEPRFLARHLHEAAADQMRSALTEAGYDVEPRSFGRGAEGRPDLVARRGQELIAVEVKVLGERSVGKVATASRWAREHGAQLRLLLVRPQRETEIDVDGLDDLVLDGLRASGNDLPALLSGFLVESVADVNADTVALKGMEGRVSGSGFALLKPSPRQGGAATDDRAVPFTYTIWFNPAERRLTQPARITWDMSELDEDA